MNSTEIIRAPAQVSRTDGTSQEIEQLPETAATAVAAREEASVKARYAMALQRPRDSEQFRVALLKECRRPGFAQWAEYHRPVGREMDPSTGEWREKIAHGASVHLIRTALALYRNVIVDSVCMYESAETRIVHAYVLDVENNVSWARTVIISKVIDKRGTRSQKNAEYGPPDGRTVVGERINSRGEKTYSVLATEDELRAKEARLLAIAQRENGRSILPRDIVDEARAIARDTIATEDAKDPDAAKRKLIDAFSEVQVGPAEIAMYLGHQLDRISPAELAELRGVYVTLRDGDSSWDEVIAVKNPIGSRDATAAVLKRKLEQIMPITPTVALSVAPASAPQPDVVGAKRHLIQDYLPIIGETAWSKVIGTAGYDSLAAVPDDKIALLLQEMEQMIRDQRSERDKDAGSVSPGRRPRPLKL